MWFVIACELLLFLCFTLFLVNNEPCSHAGSQGVSNAQFGEALKRTVDLANAINHQVGRQQVDTIDLGGGISVDFAAERHTTSFEDYLAAVRAAVPDLFDGRFRTVITENGRRYFSKTGIVMSRVEYTKRAGPRYVALQHAGADLFLRSVYHPETWPLRITVCDADGVAKPTDGVLFEYDIGGPCCIAGDVIAHRRHLPHIERGDWLMVHDVGAYMHSSWSYYNSRQAPALHFTERVEGEQLEYHSKLVRPMASVEDTLAFFRT
jgi:diaminopimelate decarboxylase